MVQWGVPEKILQNAAQTRWSTFCIRAQPKHVLFFLDSVLNKKGRSSSKTEIVCTEVSVTDKIFVHNHYVIPSFSFESSITQKSLFEAWLRYLEGLVDVSCRYFGVIHTILHKIHRLHTWWSNLISKTFQIRNRNGTNNFTNEKNCHIQFRVGWRCFWSRNVPFVSFVDLFSYLVTNVGKRLKIV